MKKQFVFIICLFLLMTLAGCGADTASDDTAVSRPTITASADLNGRLRSGTYFSTKEIEALHPTGVQLQPYVGIHVEDHTFSAGGSLLMSYAEWGTFEIQDGQLTATVQNNVKYVFDIKNEVTLIVRGEGPFGLLDGSELVLDPASTDLDSQ
ncbi:MAG: hypothetical protein J6K62_06560 [Clostridia bacterium]|nr:hypothetical protein [Clostridia bacterium]